MYATPRHWSRLSRFVGEDGCAIGSRKSRDNKNWFSREVRRSCTMLGRERSLPATLLLLTCCLIQPTKIIAIGFTSPKIYASGSNPAGIATGDFNKDGKLDICVANSGSLNITILLGRGDGTLRCRPRSRRGRLIRGSRPTSTGSPAKSRSLDVSRSRWRVPTETVAMSDPTIWSE